MKQTAELVKKCQERMKSIRDKNYFTLRFGKTKMYSEKDLREAYMVGKHGGTTQTYYEFKEWFEQFKKN